MRWLAQVAAVSMPATLAWGVLAITLINARHEQIVELALSPALRLCDWATPDEWQTLGNIPLGLFWIASSVAFYGIATGVAVCIASDVWRLRASQRIADPTNAPASARNDVPGTL